VAAFVTVRTVPNGRVGLAHIPAGAAAYHVAWPCCSSAVGTGAGAPTGAGATVGAAAARAETCSTGGAGAVVVVVVGGGVGGGASVVGVVVCVVVGVDS